MDITARQRYRAARESVTRLCGKAAAGGDLFGPLAGRLRATVGFRTGGWLRLDPRTMLPLPGLLLEAGHERAGALIRNEFFEPDVGKFRDIARRPVPVQTLWQATGGEPRRSARYRSILAGLGYGDELRVVFRCEGAAWGAACLSRSVTDPPFGPSDIAFVACICEPVARALRLSHLLAGDGPAEPAPPGVLVLGDDGEVISRTEAARHWLTRLPADRARGLDVPAAVLSAAGAARRQGGGDPGGWVRTTDGRWLRLHAERLTPLGSSGAGQTAVIIEPARPADLSPLVLELHGLTGREREIAQLLLRGLPTAEIARELVISRYTVGDHVKAIFAKLGVSSRPELTALLLDSWGCPPGSS